MYDIVDLDQLKGGGSGSVLRYMVIESWVSEAEISEKLDALRSQGRRVEAVIHRPEIKPVSSVMKKKRFDSSEKSHSLDFYSQGAT